MLAIVKEHAGPGVAVRHVETPLTGSEVRLRMEYAGICGSDLATMRWDGQRHRLARHVPFVLGHEGVGIVTEIGDPSATHLTVGDRVVPEPVIWCGMCTMCVRDRSSLCLNAVRIGSERQGTMAEELVVPASACNVVPEHISSEDAALLETMAVAIHAVRRSRNVVGADCAVVGSGAVGLMVLQVLKAVGAASVVMVGRETSRHRLETATALGAAEVMVLPDGQDLPERSFRCVFEAAGSPDALVTGLRLTEAGGSVVALGGYAEELRVDYSALARYREVDIIASRARTASDWPFMLDLLRAKKLHPGPVAFETVPLSDGERAFEVAGRRTSIKVLVDCSADARSNGV